MMRLLLSVFVFLVMLIGAVVSLVSLGALPSASRAEPAPTTNPNFLAVPIENNVRGYWINSCLVVVAERTGGMAAGKSVAVSCGDGARR